MYIFISHSSTDAKTAEDLCDVLEKNGNQCFLAPRDIRSGHEYAEEIINGIDIIVTEVNIDGKLRRNT